MLAAFQISPMTTVPSLRSRNERTCWPWTVMLPLGEPPFASTRTPVTRAARRPFTSRSTISAADQENKD
jgi:hypothetical protein